MWLEYLIKTAHRLDRSTILVPPGVSTQCWMKLQKESRKGTKNTVMSSGAVSSLPPTACSSVQSLSRVQLFVTPWIAARRASLSNTNSRSPPKPMSIELVMPSNHLILCLPFLLLPIRVFSNQSKGLSRVFSNTTVQKHQFFSAQLS